MNDHKLNNDTFIYYWVDGEVVIRQRDEDYIGGVYVVDGYHQHHKSRYGIWGRDGGLDWEHIPLEQFPDAFKLQLILLGVT